MSNRSCHTSRRSVYHTHCFGANLCSTFPQTLERKLLALPVAPEDDPYEKVTIEISRLK